MKKVAMFLVSLLFVFPMQIINAKETIQYGNTQEELFAWYMDDNAVSTFVLTSDLVIDNAEFCDFRFPSQTKTINTLNYSLILKAEGSFDDPYLKIIGDGLDINGNSHPVLWLDSESSTQYYNTQITYLNVTATKGDAVYIGKDQELDIEGAYNRDFPIVFIASRYAMLYESCYDVFFETTKWETDGENAILMLPNPNRDKNEFSLSFCEINHLNNLDQFDIFEYSYINETWMNDNAIAADQIHEGILELDEELAPCYVTDMNDFDVDSISKASIYWEDIDVNWDLSQFDLQSKNNIIKGKLLINPRFLPLIKSDLVLEVHEIVPEPIDNLDISLCLFYNETYHVRFNMSYPVNYTGASFEVSMDNVRFKKYKDDLEWYLASAYDTSYTAYVDYEIPAVSSLLLDKTYYFRVNITGGIREGYSNTIKFENGVWENMIPEVPKVPEEEVKPPVEVPNGDTNSPNITDKSEEDEPEIEVGDPDGNGGHRGDQNRDDVPEQEDEIIIEPEQIEGLDKTGEDILMMIGNQEFIVSHQEINAWKQQEETVTLSINDKNQVVKTSHDHQEILETEIMTKSEEKAETTMIKPLLAIGVPSAALLAGHTYFRRKKRAK
ncbi:MAG: hypothetical protein ACLRVU_06790 [Beduini sp.]|uniref:hypothetical protein n=1 Tax=Beduini sp. TaxID=1922300 RepID=UPI0039A165C4